MRHYLDHASTSPLRPAGRDALLEILSGDAADPGRLHEEGAVARALLEHARDEVAELFGCRSRSVVFTSGATESIAAATWGAAQRLPRVAVAPVEHSAVRRSVEQWFAPEATVELSVDPLGSIDVGAVAAAAGPETLVHVQWANHEVGTIQPIAEIVAASKERGAMIHIDAAAAAGHVPIDFDELGVDLVSVSAHKFGGPAGVGALLVRRGLRLPPLLVGGDQERARRAGLENLAGAAAFGAVAAQLDAERIATEADRAIVQIERLRRACLAIPGITEHGHRTRRVPHLLCLGFADVEPQAVLLGLDRRGIAAHSGSACASEGLEPSPVLEAMGADAERSLRFSVGWSTTDADIDAAAEALPEVLAELRALSPSAR